MNKRELTARVAKKTGLTGALSFKVIGAIFQSLQESFVRNERSVFNGFGSFSVVQRAERNVLIPSTQKPARVAARKVVKFRISKQITLK